MKKHIFLLLGIISLGLILFSCDDDDKGGKAVNITITQAKLLTGDIFAINIQESAATQLEAFVMPQSAAGAPISYKFKGTPSGAFDMTEAGLITPRVKTPAQGNIPEPLGADTIIASVNDGSGTFVRYPVRIISDTVLVSSITIQSAGQFMEIANGKTFDLSKHVTVNPGTASRKAVVYSSEDESIATVDTKGLVTAIGTEGQTTKIHITATDRGKATTTATVVIAAQPPKYLAVAPSGWKLSSNLEVKEGALENLLDDKNSTFWAPTINKRPIYDVECHLDIDLGEVINFGQFGYRHRSLNYSHLQCHTFKLQAKKESGDNWADLRECITEPLKADDYQLFELSEPVDARYIRVIFVKGHLRSGKTDWDYTEDGNVSVGDIQVFEYNW